MKKINFIHVFIKNLSCLFFAFSFVFSFFTFEKYSFCFDAKNEICFSENQVEPLMKKYAKAKENCFLFKTTDISSLNYSNIFFCVPETYFVTILQEINSAIYKVEYKGKVGYVSADSVILSTFVPVVPTLDDVFCDVVSSSGTQIRSSPNSETKDNILANIPASSKNLEYVAFIFGIKPVGSLSDVWFYVYYFPESDPTSYYEGYVFSEKVCNVSEIVLNKENNPEIEGDEKNMNLNTSKNVKVILLVLILLPIVLVFVLVAFRSKNQHQNQKENDKKDVEKNEQKLSRKSVQSFVNKKLVRKQTDDENSVEFETEINGFSPSFPTYDIVDDDDLL